MIQRAHDLKKAPEIIMLVKKKKTNTIRAVYNSV